MGKLSLGWQFVHKEVQLSETEIFLTASLDFPLICKIQSIDYKYLKTIKKDYKNIKNSCSGTD